jgi:hypothetical protein
MDLTLRFQQVTSCSTVAVDKLQTDRPYPITFVERVGTKFGPSILVSLLDSPTRSVKVFLPRRYYTVFTEDDIQQINSIQVQYGLVYKGECVNTHSHKLDIEKQM